MGDLVVSGAISKGLIHRMIDECVNHRVSGKFVKREAFLTGLKKATTSSAYGELLKAQAGANQDQVIYVEGTFYKTPKNVWGADGKAVYAIVRVGLIKALEEAGDTLPLDSYWLAAAGGKTTESIVCKSESQVTRIFLTPPVMSSSPPKRKTVKSKKGKKSKTKPKRKVTGSYPDSPILSPPQPREPAPTWVVTTQKSAKEKPGLKTRDADVVDVTGKVVTWQRKELP